MRTRNAVIGGVATVATLSVIGIGIAEAAPSSPAATPSASPSATGQAQPGHKAGHAKHKRALLARALHGEATVGGAKKQRVIDFQRGTVTAVGAGKLTVKSVDGFTATYSTDAKTKVRLDQKKSTLGEVRTGDRVRVIAVNAGGTATIRTIGDRGPK